MSFFTCFNLIPLRSSVFFFSVLLQRDLLDVHVHNFEYLMIYSWLLWLYCEFSC